MKTDILSESQNSLTPSDIIWWRIWRKEFHSNATESKEHIDQIRKSSDGFKVASSTERSQSTDLRNRLNRFRNLGQFLLVLNLTSSLLTLNVLVAVVSYTSKFQDYPLKSGRLKVSVPVNKNASNKRTYAVFSGKGARELHGSQRQRYDSVLCANCIELITNPAPPCAPPRNSTVRIDLVSDWKL